MKNAFGPTTLQQAILYFANEDICREFVARLRWHDGVVCPRCGSHNTSFVGSRKIWQCKGCRRQFSVKVGTIFEDSPIPLSKWLPATWLIASAKNGISSYELHRALDVTQKSAWFMLHRIRLAMQHGASNKFSGVIEADETFIGGKARYMHKGKRLVEGRGAVGKSVVMGLLERPLNGKGSRVRAKVVQNTKRHTVQGAVRNNVAQGSQVFTDSLPSYEGLSNVFVHEVINHAEEYVRGQVHTNGMENFWSLLKRSIKVTYVSVGPFHLSRYIDQQMFRFNSRNQDDKERFSLALQSISGKRLTYDKLIRHTSSSEQPQSSLRGGTV